MTLDTLPLFSRPRSPFGHLPLAAHVPEETLEGKAARILEHGADCDADRHTLAMVAGWRVLTKGVWPCERPEGGGA